VAKNRDIQLSDVRTGRTKFRRYWGNGGGKDFFIMYNYFFFIFRRNNGGHHCDEMTRAMKIKDFADCFRAPVDKSVKMENMKRKKEMMRNIHAIGNVGVW
jgi:hypothetical protein